MSVYILRNLFNIAIKYQALLIRNMVHQNFIFGLYTG